VIHQAYCELIKQFLNFHSSLSSYLRVLQPHERKFFFFNFAGQIGNGSVNVNGHDIAQNGQMIIDSGSTIM